MAMDPANAADANDAELFELADRLHSAAIHLLRRARRDDPATGLSSARLSALSVMVFAGPLSLGELAQAEQVSSPTITGLVRGLETQGLARRRQDADDRRVFRVSATPAGIELLSAARQRRVRHLASELKQHGQRQRKILRAAANLLLGDA